MCTFPYYIVYFSSVPTNLFWPHFPHSSTSSKVYLPTKAPARFPFQISVRNKNDYVHLCALFAGMSVVYILNSNSFFFTTYAKNETIDVFFASGALFIPDIPTYVTFCNAFVFFVDFSSAYLPFSCYPLYFLFPLYFILWFDSSFFATHSCIC